MDLFFEELENTDATFYGDRAVFSLEKSIRDGDLDGVKHFIASHDVDNLLNGCYGRNYTRPPSGIQKKIPLISLAILHQQEGIIKFLLNSKHPRLDLQIEDFRYDGNDVIESIFNELNSITLAETLHLPLPVITELKKYK